jgi:hypothetical protein
MTGHTVRKGNTDMSKSRRIEITAFRRRKTVIARDQLAGRFGETPLAGLDDIPQEEQADNPEITGDELTDRRCPKDLAVSPTKSKN